ncbi:MAG: NUDIX hydrolase [Candidatus Promineifilaceae bacterium]|nr:NUDIX hydrolase [Candidatus Promineifilaceae bacterium]
MIRKLASRVVYKNRWMIVREDRVAFADGASGIYGVVEKEDFALIVPYDGDRFHLVRQYRYPVGAAFWEFPMGGAPGSEVEPAELARQELLEETGLRCARIEKIGYLYEAYGYSNQGFHVFLARDLESGAPKREVSEQGMETRAVSVPEFERMVETGKIRDAPTLSAYGLLRLKGII